MSDISDSVDVLQATNANLVTVLQGLQGTLQDAVDAGQGPQGWSAKMAFVADGERIVVEVVDWVGGGTGATKPDTGFVGPTGFVETAAEAVNIRGDTGAAGADGEDGADGTGWTGATYDSGTGVITFTSDDGLGFSTDDLRGEKGDPGALFDWTGPWVTSTAYTEGQGVENDGSSYVCTTDHTSGGSTEPGVGGSWATVWDLTAAKGDPGAGSGDMQASTYDPQSIEGDAFDRANHTGAQAISTITGLQSALDGKADDADVFSGDYDDLTNKPTLFSGAYADLTGKPTLGTAAAADTGDFATDAQGTLADNALPKAGGTMTGTLKTKGVTGEVVGLAAQDLDLSLGDVFYDIASGSITYTFSNLPASGTSATWVFEVLGSGGSVAITWPAGVEWDGGTLPDAPADGETVAYGFYTRQGSTTIRGFVLGRGFA